MLPQLFPEGINRFPPAILALADGTIFRGVSIGAPGHTVAEVVFNTAMTGYQEILTDPSYSGQIVTLTYPHIGNTGVNAEDVEANRVYAAGLVVRMAILYELLAGGRARPGGARAADPDQLPGPTPIKEPA